MTAGTVSVENRSGPQREDTSLMCVCVWGGRLAAPMPIPSVIWMNFITAIAYNYSSSSRTRRTILPLLRLSSMCWWAAAASDQGNTVSTSTRSVPLASRSQPQAQKSAVSSCLYWSVRVRRVEPWTRARRLFRFEKHGGQDCVGGRAWGCVR